MKAISVTDVRRWIVIPAAGVGSRMQSDVPKQYLQLNGRYLIDHTIERCLTHPGIDGCYVALSSDVVYWAESEFAIHPDLVRVDGVAQRADSVLNALRNLSSRADDHDWVLVHDAARPCVRRDDIAKLIAAAEKHNMAAILGVPVHDTMKRVYPNQCIQETVSRDLLWHAYTPQIARLGVLRDALIRAASDAVVVTDEASALEAQGVPVQMVEGHPDNIKVTRPSDLELAAFYLNQQSL
jgi:2-C-methyl-D-erythritol 4-phosphate cytidylyltransferase